MAYFPDLSSYCSVGTSEHICPEAREASARSTRAPETARRGSRGAMGEEKGCCLDGEWDGGLKWQEEGWTADGM